MFLLVLVSDTINFNCMDKKLLKYSSKYVLLCSTKESQSVRFGITWGRVNYDMILGWTNPSV